MAQPCRRGYTHHPKTHVILSRKAAKNPFPKASLVQRVLQSAADFSITYLPVAGIPLLSGGMAKP